MPPFVKCLLSSMIWLGIYAPAMAQEINQDKLPKHILDNQTCQSPEYSCFSANKKKTDINNEQIIISADKLTGQPNNQSVYEGDVVIKQGHRTLKADTITLVQEKEENIVTANGNVYFHDGQFAINSKKMTGNLQTKDSELVDVTYNMLCSSGRGEAKKIFKNGTVFYQLEDGTFTTCPDGDDSWRFSAGRIEKEDGNIFADLYHTKFEVLDTPIFYLPYLRVPVEDGRLTGFLYPSITLNDRNGIEVETPFYWNIHPQVDATIRPRYMSKRGLFLSVEPRYISQYGNGDLVLEYIGNDKEFDASEKSWGINWKHSGINGHWQYNTNYSKVSDIGYFSRYTDSRVGSRQDNTLLQTGEVSYRDYNWDTSINVRSFQPLNPNTSVYRLLPQVSANYYQPDLWNAVHLKLPIQLSKFDTLNNNSKPDALRLHFEPTVTIPYDLTWLTASAEGKLLYTYYDQSNINQVVGIENEKLDAQVSRVVPSMRLHAMMTLERNLDLWGNAYTQTLEPQIQYLHIKNVDQSNIYNPVNYANGGYDTARLQTDYYGLFRSNQFSSIDYINPANQITMGAATRFFDQNNRERFNLAFGQIYYVDRPKDINEGVFNFSAWAMESELNLNDNLLVRGSLEYDSNISELQFGNATLEYRQSDFFAQTSYRYVSKNYIASTIGSTNLDLITKDGISQVGLVTGFSITDNIKFDGQIFYDLTQDMMLENSVRLTYRSDCWVIGIGYNEYLLTRSNINSPAIYDNNLAFSFSLLGLGANAGFGYSTARGNTLGYRNPFTLRN